MRLLIIIISLPILLVFLSGCTDYQGKDDLYEKSVFINPVEVSVDQLNLNQIEGTWYHKEKPFNGYSVRNYENGIVGERIGFVNGKREGVAKKWSVNGVLRVESYYKQNRLVGTYRSWWQNGVLAGEYNYSEGYLNGSYKEWYPDGTLSKFRNLVKDKEEGLQQAWLKNGKLYVNYEAKNGRIFGMKRFNSCYKLENEILVRSN